jgi:hypothetical protein
VLADPVTGRYVRGWGRRGDTAVVAVEERERPIGSA